MLLFYFPLNIIPKLGEWSSWIFQKIIPWIGKNLLHIKENIDVIPNGSGDTTYNYLLFLFFLVIAIIGSLAWTFLAKNKIDYKKLNSCFIVFLRYFLGYTMVVYGMIKIIPVQFPEPDFAKLLQPYGESSPLGLAWTFLGFSKGYNLFMGLGEIIGGSLLFHRKTKTLGGLILIPVIMNVVAINFFYDVPVKLFSSELLIIAIIIIIPDLKRIMNVILFNKPTEAIEYKPIFKLKKWHHMKETLKWSFIIYIFYSNINSSIGAKNTYGYDAPKPSLYGLYKTTSFVRNNDSIPPLINDHTRWRYLLIDNIEYVKIYNMNMSTQWYKHSVDTLKSKLTLTSYRDSTKVYKFNYKKTDSTLQLEGLFMNDTLDLKFKIKKKEDFLLTGRGFHWINEYPFNR